MSAPKSLRSAEETAREMVPDPTEQGDEYCFWIFNRSDSEVFTDIHVRGYETRDAAFMDADGMRSSIVDLIELGRKEGAAAALAGQRPVEAPAATHRRRVTEEEWTATHTSCGCQHWDECYRGREAQQCDCACHFRVGAIGQQPRDPAETNAEQEARHRAEIARAREADLADAGRATNCGTCAAALTEEPHRSDCTEPHAAPGHACTGVTARWCPVHGECSCPEGDDLDAPGCPLHSVASEHAEELPRNLAGRIRALVMEYAGRFADADDLDQADALKEAIEDLRWAAHCARVNVPLVNWIASMRRRRNRSSAHLAVLRQAADELEAIVRECGEGR